MINIECCLCYAITERSSLHHLILFGRAIEISGSDGDKEYCRYLNRRFVPADVYIWCL